jgi:hypothetical protein
MTPLLKEKDQSYLSVIRALTLLLTLLLIHQLAAAQTGEADFYRSSLATTNKGMMVLGGWAVANIATGAYGWSKFEGQQRYFHQMNFFWNTVNLGIAGIALYNNSFTDFSLIAQGEGMEQHLRTERILLINMGMNLGYVGSGFLLRHLAQKHEGRRDLLKGYGNAIILQGSFLMLFDTSLYLILRNHRLAFMEEMNLSLTTGINTLGISLVF